MRALAIAGLIAVQIANAAPAAATPQLGVGDGSDRIGAFVGARVRVPLGRERADREPSVALSIAPSRHGSGDHAGRVLFGQGVSLDFAGGAERPRLTLGRRSAAELFGGDATVPTGARAGVSTLGWVGIGVGVLVVGGALFTAWVADEAGTCPDGGSSHGGC